MANHQKTQKAVLSLSLWLQYFLDNYATVDEAVQSPATEPVASDFIEADS